MAKLWEATIYFCDPYKSYQKGAIENAIACCEQNCPNKLI